MGNSRDKTPLVLRLLEWIAMALMAPLFIAIVIPALLICERLPGGRDNDKYVLSLQEVLVKICMTAAIAILFSPVIILCGYGVAAWAIFLASIGGFSFLVVLIAIALL